MTPEVQCISRGIYERIPAEDVVGYYRRPHSILVWAVDGASTLSESPFTTFSDVSDAGWFARKISDALPQLASPSFTTSRLQRQLRTIRQQYFLASGKTTPMHDWPVAAATIVEIATDIPTKLSVTIHRYADCFELFHQEKIPSSPKHNRPAPLTHAFDEWKPHSGFTGDRLSQLRSRRSQQQRNEFSSALTLNPMSALNAQRVRLTLSTPAQILVGTDGLSRAWDTYGLMTKEEALRLVAQSGLDALLNVIRHHEASLACLADRKRRDDASGVFLSFS
ncbi:hypothetical protein PCA20602_01399 [Pandoraea capi]|uniref:PPM-type phosphatase domain-containing protein n=1 Tax=Pandoraea capi TaxID=2508286 RepID=A0ABY6VTE1_9BURK|nr:hypothetical protein [Pandoraea capi]VVD86622.1 hypothetical protein PCA20602_01399 [Pandoraea capi]